MSDYQDIQNPTHQVLQPVSVIIPTRCMVNNNNNRCYPHTPSTPGISDTPDTPDTPVMTTVDVSHYCVNTVDKDNSSPIGGV